MPPMGKSHKRRSVLAQAPWGNSRLYNTESNSFLPKQGAIWS
jgi:hypothetical protein